MESRNHHSFLKFCSSSPRSLTSTFRTSSHNKYIVKRSILFLYCRLLPIDSHVRHTMKCGIRNVYIWSPGPYSHTVATFDGGFGAAFLRNHCMIVDLVQVESVPFQNCSDNRALIRVKEHKCTCKMTCDQEKSVHILNSPQLRDVGFVTSSELL
jgi:hypothetical protein